MKKSIIGVLGVGEVGSAISEIFRSKFKVLKKDLNFDQIKNSKIDVLHVCIPYDKNFIQNVIVQIKKNNPYLTVIHSTVKPSTTAEIFKKTKKLIVHSPVMGTHPNLEMDLLGFVKVIGSVNKKAAKAAQNHFCLVGIKTIIFRNPLETEFAKLLDTTYFAWNILFNKYVKKMCDNLGLDFNNVYTQFNEIYNQGYKKSRPNVLRPVLKYMEGPIGGHCVIPNSKILDKFIPNQLTRFILNTGMI